MKTAHRNRGVSIVEALVALAVMAFGMLGVVGLQASMRYNADIAKQRSEAVRIAQERIEQARAYIALSGADSFAAIAEVPDPQPVTDYTTNTTYTWTASTPLVQTDPPLKLYEVRVRWTDRNDQPQDVVLRTNIAGVAPELAGALGIAAAGSPNAFVRERNSGIPSSAVPQGDGTSRFVPPGSGVGWVFNNTSGVITQVCNALFTECTSANLLLLSGYVNFAGELLEEDEKANIRVRVLLTQPTSPTEVRCFTETRSLHVRYYCAMPLTTGTVRKWSGTASVDGISLIDEVDAEDDSDYRMCRYTPVDSDALTVPNVDHPRTYTDVTTALINQNYLVIRARTPSNMLNPCPDDDDPNDGINTNTWPHPPLDN